MWRGLKVVISVLPLCIHFTWSWLLESSRSSTLPGPRLPFALSHHPWDIMNHLHPILLTKMGLMTGCQCTESLKHRSADVGAMSGRGSGFFLSHFWRQHTECLMRWKSRRNLFLISVHITDILRFSEQLGFASAWWNSSLDAKMETMASDAQRAWQRAWREKPGIEKNNYTGLWPATAMLQECLFEKRKWQDTTGHKRSIFLNPRNSSSENLSQRSNLFLPQL